MRTDTEILDYLSRSWDRARPHDSVVGRVYWSTQTNRGKPLREAIEFAIARDEKVTVNQVLTAIQESYADQIPTS